MKLATTVALAVMIGASGHEHVHSQATADLIAAMDALSNASSSVPASASAATTDLTAGWFNGLNVAWNQFGYDIGGGAYDESWFTTYFQEAQANGQNAARFWVHADGRASPSFNSDGSVSGLPDTFLSDLVSLTSLAQEHEIVLQLCLWSFDMCKDETNTGSTHADVITSTSKTQSYIDNALTPMLTALAALDSATSTVLIEIINEPEWCMTEVPCDTVDCVSAAQMQAFVAAQVDAVHASGFKATVGSAALKWDANSGSAETNYWSDSALQACSPTAYLDLYNVHYYDWMYDTTWGYMPCRETTSYWALDKPTVVGELPALSDFYTAEELVNCSYSNGFAGTMFWSYSDPSFPVDAALEPMKTFASEHASITSYTALKAFIDSLPLPYDPPCEDNYPYDDGYTCEEQASWGACDEDFMASPVCDKSCGRC